MAITLFRHGLTEENKRKAYLGWNDSTLCKEAVQTLSTYTFNQQAYDLFISSDLMRCLTTMNLLFSKVHPVVLPELREMNFGTFEGRTYEELKENNAYQQWINDPFTYPPADGESFEQFIKRVEKGWDKVVEIVLQNCSKGVFIVTHGGVIRYLLGKFSRGEKAFWEWDIANGTGYVLAFNLEQLRRGEHCISLQEVPSMENELG